MKKKIVKWIKGILKDDFLHACILLFIFTIWIALLSNNIEWLAIPSLGAGFCLAWIIKS